MDGSYEIRQCLRRPSWMQNARIVWAAVGDDTGATPKPPTATRPVLYLNECPKCHGTQANDRYGDVICVNCGKQRS